MKKISMLWSVLLLLAFLYMGCKSAVEEGQVTGRITLEGRSSHAGTTVELYGSGSDEPIWPIAAANSCIAFPYSPTAHFDWRMHQPLYSTTTDGAGDFAISGIPNGDYILCARQDSFGWSSPISVSIQGADMSVGEVLLYHETIFGFGYIEEDVICEQEHHYIFEGGLHVVANGVTLTIEPGAVVRFAQDESLIVDGTLIALGTPDNWIVWTSDADTILGSDWNYINFRTTASRPHFSYNRIEGTYQGIISAYVGGEFDHCFFRRAGSNCMTVSGNNIRVTNNIFYEIGGTGVTINTAENPKFNDNLLYSNSIYGIDAIDWDGGTIFNNWFEKCGSAGSDASIHFLLSNDVYIAHNEILDCKFGIHLGSRCDNTNIIQANYIWDVFTGIFFGITNDNLGPSYPLIQYNCISGHNIDSPNAYCLHVSSCDWNDHDIQAPNNYWDPLVPNLIWDYLDNPDAGCGRVYTNPELPSCPDSAGVEC
ncbi:right-handed parallel beta-helix repeat-containing protein [bacterium]|nr:right-handed parallel beta-helix repeat-containing protein [bacterium]